MRQYDPGLGRYLQPDSIQPGQAANLAGLTAPSTYLYAIGDPINIFDSNGREPRRNTPAQGQAPNCIRPANRVADGGDARA